MKLQSKYVNKIYDTEMVFLKGYETFCYQNCQKILLQAQKLSHPEMYINGTLSIAFDKKKKYVTTEYGIRSLLPSLDNKVKRYYYDDPNTKAEDVFEENAKYISKNDSAIIVGVDTYYLNYSTNYKKTHARHTAVMCGYDIENKLVYLIDWYAPWYFKGTVPLNEFLLARSSKNEYDGTMFSGESIDNNWAKIKKLPEVPENDLVNELLHLSIKQNKASKANMKVGKDAVIAMKEFINNVTNPEDSEYYTFYKQLKQVVKRYNLFKENLFLYDNGFPESLKEECSNVLTNIINDWDIMLMLLMKKKIANSERNNLKIQVKFDEITNNTEQLEKCINQLYKYNLNKNRR